MSAASAAFMAPEKEFAQDFLRFVNGSPSQFHAVEQAKQRLLEAGFKQISERVESDWQVAPGGKYFFTRNHSSIMAFAVGSKFQPGNGFSIIGAHTDSPVLKLKPKSKSGSAGFLQLGVQLYGGGLWGTWFDRDLSLAGKVIVRTESGFETRLVAIPRPILRIPNLAIHLNREVNEAGFAPNKESHTVPVLASVIQEQLYRSAASESTPAAAASVEEEHHPLLLKLISEQLQVSVSQLVDFELCLFDTQPAQLGGALEEFIFSRALDNLMMSFIGIRSLIDQSS